MMLIRRNADNANYDANVNYLKTVFCLSGDINCVEVERKP